MATRLPRRLAGNGSAPEAGGSGTAPLLVTRLGGRQRTFPVGAEVRVGRDPTLELVAPSQRLGVRPLHIDFALGNAARGQIL